MCGLPLGFFLAIVCRHLGYRVVRWFYLTVIAPPPMRPVLRPAVAVSRQAAPPPGPSKPPALIFVVKPPLVRARELIGSLLVAAAATGMCVVTMLIAAHSNNYSIQPGQCAWLFLVSLAGSWVVLVAGKFWEGSEGEPMLRRFLLMTIGLGLGLAACAAADAFHVVLPSDADLSRHSQFQFQFPTAPKLADDLYHDGQPLVMAYMAAFATGTADSLVAAERPAPFRAAQPCLAHRDRGCRAHRGEYPAISRALADDGRRLHVGRGAVGQPVGSDVCAIAAAKKEGDLMATSRRYWDLPGFGLIDYRFRSLHDRERAGKPALASLRARAAWFRSCRVRFHSGLFPRGTVSTAVFDTVCT